jgi:hypothetical protein
MGVYQLEGKEMLVRRSRSVDVRELLVDERP